MTKIRTWLDSLLARKLVVAFIVGFVGGFADTITGFSTSAEPLTTSVLAGAAIGALAAGVRAVLAFSPLNIVPSDALTTLGANPKPAELEPHPELAGNGSFAHLKLGRGPVKHDKRTLRMLAYVTAKLPAPPAALAPPTVKSWPMFGNDRLGDCTIAAIGHMIQAWTAAIGALKTLSLTVIKRVYWLTGTPPAKTGVPGGPTDDGRSELDILNYFRKTGVGGHRILAFTKFPAVRDDQMRTAVWLFGGAYLGLAMPLTAQTQKVWDVVGNGHSGPSAPGSWGGHAVNAVGYTDQGVIVVTWGALMLVTWAFIDTYCDEAYALVSQDFVGTKGTPAGFNLQQLLADVKALA